MGEEIVPEFNQNWIVMFERRDPREAGGLADDELLHCKRVDTRNKVIYLVPGSPPAHTVDGDVFEFQKKLGFPTPALPTLPSAGALEFRGRLIREEYEELMEELDRLRFMQIYGPGYSTDVFRRQMARVAGECVDLVYVIVGTMVEMGLKLMPFWREVHAKNMMKTPCPDGGKARKPEGWTKPDLEKVIYDEFDWSAQSKADAFTPKGMVSAEEAGVNMNEPEAP